MGAMLDVLEYSLREGIGTVLCSESKRDDKSRYFVKEGAKSGIVRSIDSFLVGGAPHVEYMAELGASRDDIFTGYDVVDNQYFREKSARSNTVLEAVGGEYFLTSNRFVARKNLPRLVRAYKAYRNQVKNPWRLVLLGGGPDRSRIETLISEKEVSGVVFPGFKQIEELPGYYGSAKCFIHPALREQWGLVVNEAMAAGLPVLVSETAGCRYDLVNGGENGLLFDPSSEVEIAERMCEMHRMSGEKREKMGERSSEIIANWGPSRFGRGLNSAIHRALSNDAQGWKETVTKQVVRSSLAIRRIV
jgi:glycosyltransferase involved in cell wall biosynthesis